MAVGILPETTEGVEYRIIEGYSDYAVGNDSSVWSGKYGRWKRMNPTVNVAGYYVLTLRNNSKRQYKVHRLVANAFIGPCPNGLVVNHIDGVKLNNLPSNLEYVTHDENKAHAVRMGLTRQNEGEENHRSKLSDEQVRDLITSLRNGELQGSIASRLGINQSCVSKYRLGHRRTSCGATMGLELCVPEHRGGDKNYSKGKRAMKSLIVIVLTAIGMLCSSDAYGCNRCGFMGRSCKFVAQHHVAAYVAPVVYKQPDLLIVQNNYPAPLAIQGNTQYSYQSAAAQYFVNPAQILQQAALLATAAGQTAQLGLTGYNQTAQTQLSIQASIAEPLIKSQAAVAVLGAAGLSQPYTQSQSYVLRITQGPNGPQITQENPQQLSASVTARLGQTNGLAPHPAQSQPEELAPAPSVSSLLGLKCAKCHGAHLSEPKGQVFIDTEERLGAKLDCKIALKSLQLVKSGKMPKDETISPEEKGRVMYELLDLAQSE